MPGGGANGAGGNLPPMPPPPPPFAGPPPAFWPPQGMPSANCKCSYSVQKYIRKNRAALLQKWQAQIQAWMNQAKAARGNQAPPGGAPAKKKNG